MYRTLQRLGTAPSEVEDLAQEVFLALRGSWSTYDPTRPLRPYLFAIVFRIAAAHRRKRRGELAMKLVEVADPAPGPDDLLVAKRARALLLTSLERIPLLRRAVLVMHDIDGIPVREVAAALGIPRFTVYSRLRTARRELEHAVRGSLSSNRVPFPAAPAPRGPRREGRAVPLPSDDPAKQIRARPSG